MCLWRGSNRKINHHCMMWWLFWCQRANTKWFCPANLNSLSPRACTCSLALETFVFSLFVCVKQIWEQTDVITVCDALWPSCRSDVGSNDMGDTGGVNGIVSRLPAGVQIRTIHFKMKTFPHLKLCKQPQWEYVATVCQTYPRYPGRCSQGWQQWK